MYNYLNYTEDFIRSSVYGPQNVVLDKKRVTLEVEFFTLQNIFLDSIFPQELEKTGLKCVWSRESAHIYLQT